MNNNQDKIIEFLSMPQSYGLSLKQPVQRFDTHISVVFLVGDFAYKLKRAIQLPFLDFRKLEDRKKYCELELNVNQRASPRLYETIIPIMQQKNGQLCLNGEGEIVDWLVKMKRFNQEGLFESLAEKGKLTTEVMEQLSELIADFHNSAEINTSLGGVEAMKRAFVGHYKAFENCPEGLLSNEDILCLKDFVEVEIQDQKNLLQKRQQTGYVRQCHGDLHLRNICMFEGQATLFDAIEFEPDFAIIDVFYDFSFLLMDLCHRGLVDLANVVMNRYLGVTGDVSALNLLPLFLSSRCAIRAHVNAVASQNQLNEETHHKLEVDARCYLSEAVSSLEATKPQLLAIGGLSGTGKSVLAKKIAPQFGRKPGAFIARTDLIRKRLMKVKPNEKLNEHGYHPDVTAQTYDRLFDEIRMGLKAGQSVIVDGVFAKQEERNMLQEIAQTLKIPFTGLWLEAEQHVLENRVQKRKNDPSDATVEIVKLQSNYDLGDLTWQRIETDQTIENIYKKAYEFIASV